MRIVGDEPKRLANIKKHGLDFADLDETFFEQSLLLSSYNKRWRGIGETIHGVVAVVFVTLGEEAISVISMRRASRSERKLRADR